MPKIAAPPPEDMRNVLAYDPATGDFTWFADHGCKIKGGMPAGFTRRDGYVRIGFRERQFNASRLAWWFQTGEWPQLEVDHINLVKSDNRWVNLRLATPSQNTANRHKHTWSAAKGAARMPNGKYAGRIAFERKVYHLGTFSTPELAHAAYVAKARELHGEFARSA